MKRYLCLIIVFIGFIFTIASSGMQEKPVSISQLTELSLSKKLSNQPLHTPNSELEVANIKVAAGTHITIQKNIGTFYLSEEHNLYQQVSSDNLQIAQSSLFIKDYLSHIYPSHNFW